MASFGLSQALLPTGYLMARSVYHWPLGQTMRIGNAGDADVSFKRVHLLVFEVKSNLFANSES